MEGTGHAANAYIPGVASRLHDVNFARTWPSAIFVVLGKHPHCWPQPIASWYPGPNFYRAVSYAGITFQLARHDGRKEAIFAFTRASIVGTLSAGPKDSLH